MISQEKLKELLHYNPETGVFTWLKDVGSRAKAGEKAGNINNDGYHRISVDGKRYQAHRLAWLYMKGAWPSEFIDHINSVKDDNRFANLREATFFENMHNRGVQANSLSGIRGVSWCKQKQKWRARCQLDGKRKLLGYFDTPEAASEAYETFARAAFGEFYKEVKQ